MWCKVQRTKATCWYWSALFEAIQKVLDIIKELRKSQHMPVYISMLFYITIFGYNEMKAKCHFKETFFKFSTNELNSVLMNEIGGISI